VTTSHATSGLFVGENECSVLLLLYCVIVYLYCQKLLFWSRDLCLHAILLLLSNFHTHRLKWRQDITERRFSIWRLSAILNLRKLLLWSRYLYLHVILHLRSKFHILFLLVLESKECSFAVRRSITAQTHDTWFQHCSFSFQKAWMYSMEIDLSWADRWLVRSRSANLRFICGLRIFAPRCAWWHDHLTGSC